MPDAVVTDDDFLGGHNEPMFNQLDICFAFLLCSEVLGFLLFLCAPFFDSIRYRIGNDIPDG